MLTSDDKTFIVRALAAHAYLTQSAFSGRAPADTLQLIERFVSAPADFAAFGASPPPSAPHAPTAAEQT